MFWVLPQLIWHISGKLRNWRNIRIATVLNPSRAIKTLHDYVASPLTLSLKRTDAHSSFIIPALMSSVFLSLIGSSHISILDYSGSDEYVFLAHVKWPKHRCITSLEKLSLRISMHCKLKVVSHIISWRNHMRYLKNFKKTYSVNCMNTCLPALVLFSKPAENLRTAKILC